MEIKPTTNQAYCVGVHRYSFRAGIPGLIIGVKWVTPTSYEPRLCYRVKYADGIEDYKTIKDNDFQIITFDDILKGNIPQVTQ